MCKFEHNNFDIKFIVAKLQSIKWNILIVKGKSTDRRNFKKTIDSIIEDFKKEDATISLVKEKLENFLDDVAHDDEVYSAVSDLYQKATK